MNHSQQAERLAQDYADAILRLSYTYLKNTQDAQDVCQTNCRQFPDRAPGLSEPRP